MYVSLARMLSVVLSGWYSASQRYSSGVITKINMSDLIVSVGHLFLLALYKLYKPVFLLIFNWL